MELQSWAPPPGPPWLLLALRPGGVFRCLWQAWYAASPSSLCTVLGAESLASSLWGKEGCGGKPASLPTAWAWLGARENQPNLVLCPEGSGGLKDLSLPLPQTELPMEPALPHPALPLQPLCGGPRCTLESGSTPLEPPVTPREGPRSPHRASVASSAWELHVEGPNPGQGSLWRPPGLPGPPGLARPPHPSRPGGWWIPEPPKAPVGCSSPDSFPL